MSGTGNQSTLDPDNEPSTIADRSQVFGEGDTLYRAMLKDISQAKESIRLESYIFAGDELGWQFANALAAKASSGVRVRVHMDVAGAFYEGSGKIYRYLKGAGVETRWFNRWRWRAPWHFNFRNHRKLLVVDQRWLYVGGFNLHRESSRTLFGAQRWRDVHVRLEGILIKAASALFDDLWDARVSLSPPPWENAHRLVPNATKGCRHVLYCDYLSALTAAKHRVRIVTPYFVPNRRFQAALIAAVRRGVNVQVLLPAKNNQPLVKWASYAQARLLSRHGVQFFEYWPRMLHTKVTLIDDSWSMVGSANVDYRSFFINKELNLVSHDHELHQHLAVIICEDFSEARALTLSRRPRLHIQKLVEAMAHRLRRWL